VIIKEIDPAGNACKVANASASMIEQSALPFRTINDRQREYNVSAFL